MKKTLNTSTNVNKSGSSISIFTFYTPYERNIVAFISDEVKTINDVEFKEGELGYTNYNFENISFFLNDSGELVVKGDEIDIFNIDDEGNLTIDIDFPDGTYLIDEEGNYILEENRDFSFLIEE